MMSFSEVGECYLGKLLAAARDESVIKVSFRDKGVGWEGQLNSKLCGPSRNALHCTVLYLVKKSIQLGRKRRSLT